MNAGYVPTPLASTTRARLSFGMGDDPETSMVAKTVLNDPQKNNGESVDYGKGPSSPAGSPESQMSHGALQNNGESVDYGKEPSSPAGSPELQMSHGALQEQKPSTLESMEWNPDMEEWSTQEASDWLEKSALCDRAAIKEANDNGVNGYILMMLVDETDADDLLENMLGMTKRYDRFLLLSKIKHFVKTSQAAKGGLNTSPDAKTTSPDAKTINKDSERLSQGGNTQPSTRTTTLAGEKSIVLPAYPKKSDSQGLPYFQDWSKFLVSIKMWAQLSSSTYPKMLQDLYDESTLPVGAKIAAALDNNPVDSKIDSFLGVHLYTACPTNELRELLDEKHTYEIVDGQTSGLKIISTLGNKINKRSDGKWLSLNNQITKRAPVSCLSDLGGELREIKKLLSEIRYQGYALGDREIYAIVNKSISLLVKDPALSLVLGIPVLQFKHSQGLKGNELLEMLLNIIYDVTHEDEYRYLMRWPRRAVADADADADADSDSDSDSDAAVMMRVLMLILMLTYEEVVGH